MIATATPLETFSRRDVAVWLQESPSLRVGRTSIGRLAPKRDIKAGYSMSASYGDELEFATPSVPLLPRRL
jgi:hypothetical protein